MWLLVGLGNPGAEYRHHRHNIGFLALDRIGERHGFAGFRSSKFQAEVAEGSLGPDRVLALKPATYMNLSGTAVGAAMRFYKIPLERLVVVHDEVDLPGGRLRTKRGGGAGGHNGLRSIDQHCGVDYRRLRLGIGHPGDKDRMVGHVLGNFSGDDRAWLDPVLDAVAEYAPLLLAADEALFATRATARIKAALPPA